MPLLDSINAPADLRRLAPAALPSLSREIRDFLIEKVRRSGGHLGSNLGMVEVTLALHRVFDSARDRLLWDTGHQCYVHKMLTGRRAGFDRLRKPDGLSGYPCPDESEHDIIENSHASTALSYADGLARAYQLAGVTDRSVVVVVGDGSLTGGMAWEALNNIGAAPDREMVIVLNDNGRSYAPTVGGIARHLAALRRSTAPRRGSTIFENLGLDYLGPVDGHNVLAVESALREARQRRRPVVVHCVTRKGAGYPPAEADQVDHQHAVRATKVSSGDPLKPSGTSWTARFSTELLAVAERRSDVVALTAAMPEPTGLLRFQDRHPERVIDVGIAEQHAVTTAVGFAIGGFHPVIAIYATFLNRAFDQILTDLALHRRAATFVLDRAGVTGDDGPSHNGMWDLSVLQVVPGIRIAAPRDGSRLAEALGESVARTDGPSVIRFPKGDISPDLPAVRRVGGVDVLAESAGKAEVLIVGAGSMATVALGVRTRLADLGIAAAVVDPRWLLPVDPEVVRMAGRHRLVVTIEDNVRVGGFGSAVAQALANADVPTPVRIFGLPHRFLAHGDRAGVLAECGLTVDDIVRDIGKRHQNDAGLAGAGAGGRQS